LYIADKKRGVIMLKTVIDNKIVEDFLQEHEDEKEKIIVNALIEFILKKRKLGSEKAKEFKILIKSNKKHHVEKSIDISQIADEVNL
jgi:hypothetical protein